MVFLFNFEIYIIVIYNLQGYNIRLEYFFSRMLGSLKLIDGVIGGSYRKD